MANNETMISIPGRLHSVATEGHVAGADEIFDDTLNKDQATINAEVSEAIGTGGSVDTRIANAINALDATESQSAGADGLALNIVEADGKITSISGSIASNTYDAHGAASTVKSEVLGSGVGTDYNTLKKIEDKLSPIETAVGSGGSVDSRIATAKAEIIGDAATDYNTLGKIEDKLAPIEEVFDDVAFLGEDDGSETIADFDPQADSLWKGAQVLSSAEKAQVKTNLGLPQEIYSKTEVNSLITTPNQQYVTVATYASLPASGSADTIYRVSNYNGSTSQVDATMYSEYAWNGTEYEFLCVKSQVGEVFDISAYNSNTKYTDLAAALGTNGANVPEGLRKGGMSVKYVSNSDNKYVQYRLMADSFNTTTSNWQGVSGKLIAGSKDLAESGAILKDIFDSSYQNDIEISWTNGKFYYKEYGKIVEGSVAGLKAAKIDVSQYIGQSLKINCICSNGQPSSRARNAVTDSEDNVLLELNTTPDRNPEYITVPEGSKYLYLSYYIELNITEGYVKKGGDINSVIKNLLVGNRYLGLLEQAGAVSTPASTNTFYLASGAGTYNFADNSSFVLKDKEIGIFLFSESGIEKKKISSYTNFWNENNLINYNTLASNKYIDYTNGSVASIQGAFASDYIEVIPRETVQITYASSSWGAFYDESKNFVSKYVARNNNGMANLELQVPDNAKYIRLTVSKGNILTKLYRSKGMYPIKMRDIPSVVIQSSVFDNDCNFADTPVEGKKADVTSGTIIDDSSKKYVKCLIPSGADIVSINILPDSIAWGTSGNTITGSIEPTLEIHRPEDAQRFNLFLNFGINDDISTLQCLCVKSVVVEYSMQGLKVPYLEEEIGRLGTEVRNQWKEKKIVWLGTSIPWGQSDEDEPGTHRVAHPYPQQVCAALGATLVDSTHGGLAQMADYNSDAQLWVPKNYGSTCLTSAECVAAYNAGLTSSDKSAFSFENTILGKNADLYVFDVEPNNSADGSLDDLALFNWYTWQYTNGTSIASHRNTYIGALIYEIDKLLTEKPDAIIVFIGEFLNMKSDTYQDDYDVRTASRQLCEKFHIHYIDLSEKLIYLGKNKNVWLNSDMIHPKRATYDRIAKILINELLLIA